MESSQPPDAVLQSSDLDLSVLSHVGGARKLDEENKENIRVPSVRFASVKESASLSVLRFEQLEHAAENHDSFSSNLSYAKDLWEARPGPILMPPSLFEENDQDDTLNNEDQLIQGAEIVESLQQGAEDDMNDPLSDTDTHSVASVGGFHDSLPIVSSTPSKHRDSIARLSMACRFSGDSPGNRLDVGSKVDRRLLPDLALKAPENAAADLKNEQHRRGHNELRKDLDSNKGPTSTVNSVGNAPGSSARSVGSVQSASSTISVGDGSVLEELQEKLKEIKSEISKLKSENARATKVRLEYDALMRQLEKDRKAFETEKAERLRQLDEIAKEEGKKLEMEKKILYRHFAAQKAEEDKKLAMANEELLKELQTVKDTLKNTEDREHVVGRRLKERVKALEEQNDRLKDKADALEEEKLELVREVVRLTKRGSTKGVTATAERPQTPSSAPTPRNDGPPQKERNQFPSDMTPEAEDSNPASAIKSVRRPADHEEKVSPRNVRFELESSICSANPEEQSVSEKVEKNGTIEKVYKDGRRVRIYKNGTKRETSADGKCSVTTYFNGDVHQILPDKEVYFYASNETIHTKFPDGSESYQFSNNQSEMLFPDGKKQVRYPNGVTRIIHPSGNEECQYPNGDVVYWNDKTKTRTIHFANGELETHTPDWKKREFRDGAVKVIFSDGRTETKYADGRIRRKDCNGKLTYDSQNDRHL